ncbi:MAG: hypothetical protein LUQ40_06280, partial [Methanomicrobiales archaeon]|nr:hypothetical protein [Methanomicrobiales archaeon]
FSHRPREMPSPVTKVKEGIYDVICLVQETISPPVYLPEFNENHLQAFPQDLLLGIDIHAYFSGTALAGMVIKSTS